MLFVFSSHPFYTKHVHLPTADDPPSSTIHEKPKLWSYFKNALGALDGSHIHSASPLNERVASRNRKGFISQNCLLVAHLSSNLSILILGGRVQQQMHVYMRMHS